ncbi:transporter [Escherichia coli]|uniref:Transporter n=1 Tax=Escherichia coli TaxID=562 RepID=A0A377AL90_ECOLX|nr:transporter [Escherichia coli]
MKTSNGVVEKDYTLAESMRKPQYWMLAVMFLTACMSGLYVIGVAKDIAQSLAHLDVVSAANAVTVFPSPTFQVVWCWVFWSDKIARIRVITIGQVISLVGMAALLFAPLNAVTFFAAIACVAFNFGGTITVFPSLVSGVLLGLNNLAKNYGVIYLGFGIGSICGSIIASLFGGFYVTFYVIFALLILSLALSTTIRQPEQKMLREAHGSL